MEARDEGGGAAALMVWGVGLSWAWLAGWAGGFSGDGGRTPDGRQRLNGLGGGRNWARAGGFCGEGGRTPDGRQRINGLCGGTELGLAGRLAGLAASAGRGGGRRTDANALMIWGVGLSWAWLAGWLGWRLLRGGGADAGRTPTHS